MLARGRRPRAVGTAVVACRRWAKSSEKVEGVGGGRRGVVACDRLRVIEEYNADELRIQCQVRVKLTDPIPHYSTLPTNWTTHHLLARGGSQRFGYKPGSRHYTVASRMQ